MRGITENAAQKCSGKTFTMRGITENAVTDIFEHIKNINNETVVDILKRKSGSLWLLDDSEKGTIVDKPQEEIVEKLANI